MQPAATAHHEVEGRSRRQDSLVELGESSKAPVQRSSNLSWPSVDV
jgi:hypothetical protein